MLASGLLCLGLTAAPPAKRVHFLPGPETITCQPRGDDDPLCEISTPERGKDGATLRWVQKGQTMESEVQLCVGEAPCKRVALDITADNAAQLTWSPGHRSLIAQFNFENGRKTSLVNVVLWRTRLCARAFLVSGELDVFVIEDRPFARPDRPQDFHELWRLRVPEAGPLVKSNHKLVMGVSFDPAMTSGGVPLGIEMPSVAAIKDYPDMESALAPALEGTPPTDEGCQLPHRLFSYARDGLWLTWRSEGGKACEQLLDGLAPAK